MNQTPIIQNTLFYGENLDILRDYIPNESIDLIYLDPPFNSNRNYNVLFKDESGIDSEAQITAFEDTWHWNYAAEQAYHDLITQAPHEISKLIAALRDFTGTNQMMAYLVMMTIRLVELHRVLKSSGSIYLHCDPTASHYLKIIMDTIFGVKNFMNELVWERFNFHADAQRWGRLHDTIFFYAKDSSQLVFHTQRRAYDEKYIKSHFKQDEQGRLYRYDNILAEGQGAARTFFGKTLEPPKGTHWRYSQENIDKMIEQGKIVLTKTGSPTVKRYLDEMPGHAIGDVWTDIAEINSQARERLGYPTQKPLALLERIITASSNPNDIILDPFCGCGTAIAAAQKLERRWIGIDVTQISIALQKFRLQAMFPGIQFNVIGEPTVYSEAKQLAKDDRYQFQWWALSLIPAKPIGGQVGSKVGKKGSDKGIDGVIPFIDDPKGKPGQVLVQVKSGHVKPSDIRDLVGTVKREGAAIGVFVTLEEPSHEMKKEAFSAGFYHSLSWNRDYPAIQILTIEELIKGKEIQMPPQYGTFKQAQKIQQKQEILQPELNI